MQLNTPCSCLYSKCVYNANKGCIFVLWSMLVFKIAVIFFFLSLLPKITLTHTCNIFCAPWAENFLYRDFPCSPQESVTLMLGIISWVIQRTTHTGGRAWIVLCSFVVGHFQIHEAEE